MALKDLLQKAKSRCRNSHRMRQQLEHPIRYQVNDPFNKLPPELRCEIFREYSLFPPKKDEEQLAALSVCESWRDDILSDPIFWTTLHIPHITDGRFGLKEIKLWLSRSNKLPLSIVFRDQSHHRTVRTVSVQAVEEVQRALEEEKHRIFSVIADYSKWFIKKMVNVPTTPNTTSTDWPTLTRIAINHLIGLDIAEVAELLRHCPKIESLELCRSICGHKESEEEIKLLNLHHLKNLSLDFDKYDWVAGLLANLECPELKTVTYRCNDDFPGSSSALEGLFQRSGCAVTTLRITYPIFDGDSFVSLLKSQPSLRKITTALSPYCGQSEMDFKASITAFKAVLQLLVPHTGRHGFLPNLEVLEHEGGMLYPWDDIVDVYSAHNQILEQCQLELASVSTGFGEKVPSSTCRPLRLLNFRISDCVPRTDRKQPHNGRMMYHDTSYLNPVGMQHAMRPPPPNHILYLNPLTKKHVHCLTAYTSNTEMDGSCRFECGCDISLLETKFEIRALLP